MLVSSDSYNEWLSIIKVSNGMDVKISRRMRCAFEWADAVVDYPRLSDVEIASMAASTFNGDRWSKHGNAVIYERSIKEPRFLEQ